MNAIYRLIPNFSAATLCLGLLITPVQADMMKDSPVTFPVKGALPSKYPPDVSTKRDVPEKDYANRGGRIEKMVRVLPK